MWNNEWKKGVDYPNWGDTEVYKKTIAGGYLLQGETPRDAYMRVCNAVARRLYKPEMAEMELDVFSDLIWEGVLNNASYLENISAMQLFLFKVEAAHMKLIVVKTTNENIDFRTHEGFKWLQKNFAFEEVEFFTANKDFTTDKKGDIFSLIEQGAIITKGDLFMFFDKMVN